VALPGLDARIVTERLILRPPRTSDAKALSIAMRDNAEHLAPWLPSGACAPAARKVRVLAEKIAEQRKLWRLDHGYALLVFEKGNERAVIGRAQINAIVRGVFQNAYLGYWIAASKQGQGLMTEAVRGAVSWAFSSVGLHRVQAAVIPRNAGSLRVLEKVGFRREGLAERYLKIAGRWQDHVIWAVTAEEFDRV
jgi:ribosomal-protein-alanine N-acetyltransferase